MNLPMPGQATFRRWAACAVVWLAMLTPGLLYVAHFHELGRLQRNDYYGGINRIQLYRPLLLRSSEHIITVPGLMWVANMYVTHGDNRGLAVLTLLFQAVALAALVRVLPEPVRRRPWACALAGFVMACLLFTPVAVHNVVMGFSGTQWCSVNACAAWAFSLLVRPLAGRPRLSNVMIVVLGFVAFFCHSTSLAIWPVLIVGSLILARPWRQWLAFAIFGAALFLFYGLNYRRANLPTNLPPASAWMYVKYLGTYLGGLLVGVERWSTLTGWVGIAALLVLTFLMCRTRDGSLRSTIAPWVMLAAFGLGNALGTGVARHRLGLEQAYSSRYATLPAIFWIGVFGLLIISALQHPGLRRIPRAVRVMVPFVVITAGLAGMYKRGSHELQWHLRAAADQPLAELALVRGIRDFGALWILTPAPAQAWNARQFFVDQGHVPFDRPHPDIVGTRIDPSRLRDSSDGHVTGEISEAEPVEGGYQRLKGLARSDLGPVTRVYLIDEQGVVCGETVYGLPRYPYERNRDWRRDRTKWAGYLWPGFDLQSVRAYVELEGGAALYRLTDALADSVPPQP